MQSPHVNVCICTFKRPALLRKLLLALETQRTDGLFSFSAVVADNDSAESAREVVNRVSREVSYRIEYFVEPRQNIALARNRSVVNAPGDFIATIDDDEEPCPEWLYHHFQTLAASQADGALGPVRPSFGEDAPQWLIRSGLCERDSYPTGTVLTRDHPLRCGNTFLHRRVFDGDKNLFEEEYGRTGGEDSEFFDKRMVDGFTFIWCDEAPVYEDVLPERYPLSFQLKRFIRSGALTGEKMRIGTIPLWPNLVPSLGATVIHTVMLPVYAVCGKHIFARYLAKDLYHVNRVLGTLGVVLIRER